jgi:hypothetical protein
MSTSTSSAAETGGDLLGCSPNEAKILETMDTVCSTVARLIQWADRVIVDGKTEKQTNRQTSRLTGVQRNKQKNKTAKG